MKLLPAGLLVVCLFGGSVCRASASEHVCTALMPMGVYLEMREGQPRVYVDFRCEKTLQRAVVDDMLFFDDDVPDVVDSDAGTLHLTPPICRLERTDSKPSFPTTGWDYGKPLRGFTMKGACKPLERGKRYHVTVFGSGIGGVRFEIDEKGELHVTDDECRPAKSDASTTQ